MQSTHVCVVVSAFQALAVDKSPQTLYFEEKFFFGGYKVNDVLGRIVAVCGLVLLFTLLCIIACVIMLDSPGNPFFTQKRVGKDGALFTIFKFRTMRGVDQETEA